MTSALRFLLRLFPSSFRDRFADELAGDIARDYESARSQSRAASLRFVLVTAVDLVRAAVAERWQPTWTAPYTPPPRRRGMSWSLSEWSRDLRHAWRSLKRTPGFTATAVITLTLAIGVNAGMFSVVKTVLLDPLPFAHADRLVYIAGTAPGTDLPPEFGVSAEFYLQYKEQSKLLEDVALFNTFTSTMRVGDRVERIRMSEPTNSLFSTLGVQPIIGRLSDASDENRAAVISYALWKNWFNGDSGVVGRTYSIASMPRTIVGVMGPEFRFPDDQALLWLSNTIHAAGLRPGRFGYSTVGRMAPGVSLDALVRELTSVSKRLPERFGGSPVYARIIGQHRAVVRPFTEQMFGEVSRPLWVLLGAVAMVLIIACANVANLFAVRAEGRHRELAVRHAIGAARGQLVRLQMAEAVVVAGIAGVLALVLARVTLPVFLHVAPADVPRIGGTHIGVATLVFTLGVVALAAIACGAIPAVRASSPDLARLREGGRGATRGRHWARDGMVVAQTALALVLLIASGLLVRSFWTLQHVDPGYSTKDIFTFQIAPEQRRLRDGPSFAQFDLEFVDRLRKLPGVQMAGLVENIPLDENTHDGRFHTEATNDPEGGTLVAYTFTAADYFKAMGIRQLAGHPFETSDHLGTFRSVVVSQSAAKLLWPGQDPIGKRLQLDGTTAWANVVGVVNDVMQNDFREKPRALVYFPLVGPTPMSWMIDSPAYVIKTSRAEVIAPEVRALVHEVAPEAPMYRVFTMSSLAKRSMAQLSFLILTLGIASALALVLGAVGLYGVLSYVVAERTREIGVRMALGARASQVRRMVVAQGSRVVLIGVVIGVGVALASTRALGKLLYGVASVDVATFTAMSVAMIGIGLLASYVPARRASNVDPIESLRGD